MLAESPYAARIDARKLRAAARETLEHQSAQPRGQITLLITGDGALRRLSRAFLGKDSVTDVLSFPSTELDPRSGARHFGDIAIAYPRARAQARRGRHPIWAELQLLVVHGVLHLLGHDHAKPAEKKRMWAAQAAILARLKTPIIGPTDN